MVILLLAACGDPPNPVDTSVTSGDDTQTDDTSGIDSTLTDSGDSVEVPLDADQDGHLSLAAGGDDCDDTDAYTYPGATDWCDGTDQDCDGDPVGDGMCTEATDVDALHGVLWWTQEVFRYFNPHAVWSTSEGDALVGGGVYYDAPDYLGGVEVYTSVEAGERPAGQWWGCTPSYLCVNNNRTVVGDFNGDGFEELLTGGPDWGVYIAAVFLLSGDTSTWPAPGTPMPDSALASWIRYRAGDDFATSMAGGVDLNADGLSDFIVYAPAYNGKGDYQGSLHVMMGRTGDLPQLENAGEEITFLHQPHGTVILDDHFLGGFSVVKDIDGDGMDDLLASGWDGGESHAMYWASGSAIPEQSGADLVDVFERGVDLPTSGTLGHANGGSLGDLDGDGINDIVFDESTEIAFLSGAAIASGTGDGVLAIVGGSTWMNVASVSLDVDRDAVLDPFVGATSDAAERRGCYVASARLTLGGRTESVDLGPCFDNGGLPADLDDDGAIELHFPRDGEVDGEYQVQVRSVPLFDIPWEDPTKW